MLKSIAPKMAAIAAVAAASIGGAAFAQGPAAIKDWSSAPHPAGSVIGPREDDPAYLRYQRQVQASIDANQNARNAIAEQSDVAYTAPLPPPASWNGSADAWNLHMRACTDRFQTYNPETDMYFPRPGVRARCGL